MEFTALTTIMTELTAAAERVDNAGFLDLVESIRKANRVFVGGVGRSGLVGGALANRLLHLGIPVALIGESTTPPIAAGDLLIAVSGSGKTTFLRLAAERTQSVGARVAAITIDPDGPIGLLADVKIVLPGTTRLANDSVTVESVQPVGSLFEQLAWLVCDALVLALRDALVQTNDDLLSRHANLE